MLIKNNILKVLTTIKKISKNNNRNPKNIKLIIVTKNQNIHNIKKIIRLNLISFGENYVKEAIEKIFILNSYNKNLEWHFIGRLQSNKIALVAQNFSWCHSVNSIKTAQLLNNKRPMHLSKLNILIQVNLTKTSQKNGINTDLLFELSNTISTLPRLNFRGIMIFPDFILNYEKKMHLYKKAKLIFEKLKKMYKSIDTLSLGTSYDMKEAIISGSTMLRIGTAIFNIT